MERETDGVRDIENEKEGEKRGKERQRQMESERQKETHTERKTGRERERCWCLVQFTFSSLFNWGPKHLGHCHLL